METRRLYLIDGVRVPLYVYRRREQFGEHPGAAFRVVDVPIAPRFAARRRH